MNVSLKAHFLINVAFIKVVLKFQTIYYMIIYVSLTNVNVSSNEYYIDNNLILIANGLLQFRHVFSFKIFVMTT